MKKCISLILIMLLLCGCGNNKEEIVSPANFYYCNAVISYNSPTAVLAPEVRESAGYDQDLATLVNDYLAGPASSAYISPFPEGSAVREVYWEDTVLQIKLNPVFAELKGLDLTIACACLSRTLIELTGCSAVTICAENASLDGYGNITMNMDSVLLLDASF